MRFAFRNCKTNPKLTIVVFGSVSILLLLAITKLKLYHDTVDTRLRLEETNEARRSRLEKREIQLKEIEHYNKENIKNEKRRLPKVIGIGVKKCGTHGIIGFLDQHPLIRIPEEMEMFFFSSTKSPDISFYRKRMPPTNDRQVAMEKTPIYFAFPPTNIPYRIKTSIPHVKLILIVCDPTPRAFSDYVHERIRHELYGDPMIKNYKTFEQYVDEYLPQLQRHIKEWQKVSLLHSDLREKLVNLTNINLASTVLSNGIYSAHIKQWQSFFNSSTLKVVDGKRFMQDPGPVIEELQDFIGIPKVLLREDFVRHPDTGFFCYRKFTMQHLQNQSTTRSTKSGEMLKCLGGGKGRTRNGMQKAKDETLHKLRAFYRPFNHQFFTDIGEDFKWD